MFKTSAEFYDLIYSTIKDYASEARQLARLLRNANPGCRTVLDVACGTGEHARHLAALGFVVDGLDADAAFVRIAREKNPQGRFFERDMSEFLLPHRYDAVVCLFSSIGYLRTLDRVEAALKCFSEHLAPNGIIAVEPWFGPGALDPNRVAQHTGEADRLKVTRTSRVAVDGRLSRLYFDYEIAEESGTRFTSEIHELGLFTAEEMLGAFERAGLAVEFDPKGLFDRGLYLAHSREGLPDGARLMSLLFSYGTLQEPQVQLDTFGRLLTGEMDELVGFEPSRVKIEDPDLVGASGRTHHANVTFNGKPESRVSGTAFEVTDSELAVADGYERPADYVRVAARLASGKSAWVYLHKSSTGELGGM